MGVQDQVALWNGPAGRAWVASSDLIDQLFAPFEAMLVEAAATRPDGRVLDVGCGAGGTTLAIARALGPTGHCEGVDLSGPLVELARARAARAGSAATFIHADAASHPFEPGTYNVVVSRFGVMFFDDFVGAFANLRRATKAGGRLRCLTFRDPAENPFMTTAERAAAPLLPGLPPRDPDARGQFGLADRNKIHGILAESGWAAIAIQPIDVPCAMPAAALDAYITQLGPVGMYLQGADAQTREHVFATVRAAFAPYVTDQQVEFKAACWLVEARAEDPRR